MVFERRKNILAGLFQFHCNAVHIGKKINITPSLVFLISIFLIIFIIFVWRIDLFAFKNLLVFILLGGIFIFGQGVSYYLLKRSDIYMLEAAHPLQDGFLPIFNNSLSGKEVLYKDILKLSFVGYNFIARTNIWTMHYVIEHRDLEGKIKELLIPLDIRGLFDFLKIIIEKTGLTKVKPSQSSLLYEWRRLNAGENMEIARENDFNPIVVDPNASLSNAFNSSGKKQLQEVSYFAIVLALVILGIFIYLELVSLKFI